MDSKDSLDPVTPKSSKKTDAKNEFSAAKPLPPIGSLDKGEESDIDEKNSVDTRSVDRDDARSSISQGSNTFDRLGENSARPRIIRGFRPEVYSDDEDFEDDKKLGRRVSFTEVKERMFRTRSPAQRETNKRRTYDGREVTFVSLDTQTDWDWVSDIEAGTARTIDSEKSVTEETALGAIPKSETVEESHEEEKLTHRESVSYPMPYNDEYGIPILDLSSDTDDSSDEEFMAKKKLKDERNFIPSVGPPIILQYQRESEKHDIDVEDPESRLPRIDSEDEDKLERDEHGMTHGMFSGMCEFCNKDVLPFPTLEQQQQFPPEQLYCCNDYREFVEFALNASSELEEEQKKKNKLISVKVHEHVGSKQERNAAKEKAVQRMRERELQRRAQEASGLQQNFFALDQPAGSQSVGSPVSGLTKTGHPTTRFSNAGIPTAGFSNVGQPTAHFSNAGIPTAGFSNVGQPTAHFSNAGIPTAGFYNSGQSTARFSNAGIPTGGLPNARQSSAQFSNTGVPIAGLSNARFSNVGVSTAGSTNLSLPGDGIASFWLPENSSLGTVTPTKAPLNIARQMKTINYQLSSQKCLEEGWTLRAPSPMLEELGDNVFEPEPLDPAMVAEGRLRERPLIEKFYETGQKFLTMFPDGTGNVFYPSGNLAILISSVKLGQYHYTIRQDAKKSGVAAAFEPNGYGYCYYPNGDVRLYIDQYGGLELDSNGGKKRKWQWKDHVTHVHAPPFQPICIGLNRHLAVRVMSQENIVLTFSASQRSCRFNVGSRLKADDTQDNRQDIPYRPIYKKQATKRARRGTLFPSVMRSRQNQGNLAFLGGLKGRREFTRVQVVSQLVAPENVPLKEIEENQIFLEEKKNYVGTLLDKVSTLLRFPNSPKIDKILPPLHVTNKITKTEKLKKERKSLLAQQSARDKKQPPISVS